MSVLKTQLDVVKIVTTILAPTTAAVILAIVSMLIIIHAMVKVLLSDLCITKINAQSFRH